MIIESAANTKIKLLAKLIESKRYRRSEGLAVIEGARLCAEALSEEKNGRLKTTAVFATEQALEKYGEYIDPRLFENGGSGKYFLISEQLAHKLSDTKAPQGIFAEVKLWDIPLTRDVLSPGGRYAVLDGLQDPGNIGTVIRTADALGFMGAILLNNCCELYNPKLLRSAMGSAFRLPIYTADTLLQAAEVFGECGITSYAAVVDSDARPIGSFKFAEGSAVVIGNEGAGLSSEDAALCSERVTIKMQGRAESLNAASAAAILLWEMSKRE